MSLSGKEYEKMTKRASPSPKLMNLLKAFLIGGLICAIGEGFSMLYESLGADEKTVSSLVPCTLVVIAAVLTALGVFDKIARHAGAGTLVPITGFANAVVSPAMEFQSEGRILGTGANMFKVAGPVSLGQCRGGRLRRDLLYRAQDNGVNRWQRELENTR